MVRAVARPATRLQPTIRGLANERKGAEEDAGSGGSWPQLTTRHRDGLTGDYIAIIGNVILLCR